MKIIDKPVLIGCQFGICVCSEDRRYTQDCFQMHFGTFE